MKSSIIFLPALIQVLLTLFVFIQLALAKSKAVKAKEINEDRRALYDDAWPESVIKINNNIRNQFEVPVLFYFLTIVLWALNATGIFVLSVASLFVASRIVHAYIHTGSNFVPVRRKVFSFGCLMVIVMALTSIFAVISNNGA